MRHCPVPAAAPPEGAPATALVCRSDEELARLCAEGHEDAFEVLVMRYRTLMLAYCRRLLRSPDDAEDVVQEVFAAVFSALARDQGGTRFRPWLYRTAHNRCVTELRRRPAFACQSLPAGDAASGPREPADPRPATADRAAQHHEVMLLMGDVRRLPSTQREALVLREFDALSYEQVADEMRRSVPSVKSLLLRARSRLADAAAQRAASCRGAGVVGGLTAYARGITGQAVGGAAAVGGGAASKVVIGLSVAALAASGLAAEQSGRGHRAKPAAPAHAAPRHAAAPVAAPRPIAVRLADPAAPPRHTRTSSRPGPATAALPSAPPRQEVGRQTPAQDRPTGQPRVRPIPPGAGARRGRPEAPVLPSTERPRPAPPSTTQADAVPAPASQPDTPPSAALPAGRGPAPPAP
jgi:RNA polymerase sigma factor (sigma-70 family)